MAEFFYINDVGSLVRQFIKMGDMSIELSFLCTRLDFFDFKAEEYIWFKDGMPLDTNALISDQDRLFALKRARLSPAQWRAQRVARS